MWTNNFSSIEKIEVPTRNSRYCVMRVSLRPRCITHYRNSVGLISTRCGKLMDRPPQSSQPLQFYRLVAPRSAALQPHYRVQCPYRWKLFHFTTAPPKDSLPPRVNQRRTMHSHNHVAPVGAWKYIVFAAASLINRDTMNTDAMHDLERYHGRSPHLWFCFYLHT